MTNYVSAVPLKELGLGLGIEHLGDEQAQELTDDYSLPALKVRPGGDTYSLWEMKRVRELQFISCEVLQTAPLSIVMLYRRLSLRFRKA